MATTTPINTATKSVDASLWWDPFSDLLTELEIVPTSGDLPPPLVKKLKDNQHWLVDTVSQFKKPNQKSREALDAEEIRVGSNQLTVKPDMKAVALKFSSALCIDEVQSYILVKRSIGRNTPDPVVPDPLHLVMLQYYIERQCLLKCTRQIFMLALYVGADSDAGCTVRDMVKKLISDGLESKLLSVLEDLLSSSYPDHIDVDLFTLWAEEILIEDNLVLDILFLAYYESFCTCDGKQWKKLCLLYEGMISGSCNFGKLAISTEAVQSIRHAKVQLLLILVETLYLENLLQMVHDEMPFRQGTLSFAVTDIQDMDAFISSFTFETNETGPLILTWAVFLCLISSLPEEHERNVLMEIDHVSYVRQAFEAAALKYFLEILQNGVLKDSDGPIAGYRSVMRTFISAFIASYEISLQLEDNNLKLILAILGEIYRGEESLCIQFWDRDSFIDGPIRCLLCNLEGEFPFRTVELVHLLSALSEGPWPAECVYNFLDKSVGLSSLFEITGNLVVDNESRIVETKFPLHVPGLEGFLIPSRTRGHVLKAIDANTALVRWEYTQSGVLVLLLHVAQEMYPDGSEEILVCLDLFVRLVTFNMAVCNSLMNIGNLFHGSDIYMNGLNVVEILCTLIKKLSPNHNGALMMSMGVNILTMMLKCCPSQVTPVVLKANIFDVALRMNPFNSGSDGISSGSWLLSGRLAKMILIDCEHNDRGCPLAVSVLEFTSQLVETGVQNDFILSLVIFSIQYILVNHEFWKYKVRHLRWRVTLKVLEVTKKCILSTSRSWKMGEVVRDLLLCDSSIHSSLFRIVCTTTPTLENLYVSRLYEFMEIEGLQLAICAVLDILFSMLSDFSKDGLSSFQVFHQAVLSSTTKPVPVVTAVISLISFSRNPKIQEGAMRVLSMLLPAADDLQPYVVGNACFSLDDKQIADFRNSIIMIISEQSPWNEDLIVKTFKMLVSAAHYQPAFLLAVIGTKENSDAVSFESLGTKDHNLLDAFGEYIGKSAEIIKSHPKLLLSVLEFMASLWEGAAHFINVLERLKKVNNFWRHLTTSVLLTGSVKDKASGSLGEGDLLTSAYTYWCQSNVLQVMVNEIFLQRKVSQADVRLRQNSELSKDKKEEADHAGKPNFEGECANDILSSWCQNSVLSNLIKSYTSCDYDSGKYFKAKVSAAMFCVLAIEKLRSGHTGSLSVSLVEETNNLEKELINLPAFSELLIQYKQNGYSDGKELYSLVLSDLYYHLQGELEGRAIEHKLFKELFQFLLTSKALESYQYKYDENISLLTKDIFLFDSVRLRSNLGIDVWDFSEWKTSKAVAETMLGFMQDVNCMVLRTSSKLSALRVLATILPVYDGDSNEKGRIGEKFPEQQFFSCIEHICQCLHATIESLVPVPEAAKEILDYVAGQAELLLHLIISMQRKLALQTRVHVLKTMVSCLKVLKDFGPLSAIKSTMKILLTVLLSSVQVSSIDSSTLGVTDMESVEAYADLSSISLRLLPILCYCMEPSDHCTLSLTTIDCIMKGFLTPTTWFPIIERHLQVPDLVKKLQDPYYLPSVPVILKFLLTFARARGGAEILVNAGFFASLRVLFTDSSNAGSFSIIQSESSTSPSISSEKIEKPQHIWGLGLAVVTAIIHSLGDIPSCSEIVDYVITYFLLEKSYLVSCHLNTPDYTPDVHSKKRAHSQKVQTSLSSLKETQHTLMLICGLVRHRNIWSKAVKDMDAHLRERSIHLLAFISRGSQHLGESTRVPPLLCHPILKEEVEWYKKPSFINSRNGWFSLSALGCGPDPRLSSLSSSTAHVVKDSSSSIGAPQTCFSDTAAIQIYRIAFYILKFLCLQADIAAKRAEEVGFVDVAHFPELPAPDILHGLQDQGCAIVHELCEANKLKQVPSEIESICILLLHITEMSLYLEFCVSQICGIRPVMGRIEDFSKELKLLIRGTEGHEFLKDSMKSLKQIVSVVYPGLLQTEGFL